MAPDEMWPYPRLALLHAFGITAPLVMSLCLSLDLGWRNAVLVGVALWWNDRALVW